jgi:hypothetical protein
MEMGREQIPWLPLPGAPTLVAVVKKMGRDQIVPMFAGLSAASYISLVACSSTARLQRRATGQPIKISLFCLRFFHFSVVFI